MTDTASTGASTLSDADRAASVDRAAIRDLLERYADAVFRRDFDQWADCWAQDAEWEILQFRRTGRAEVRALVEMLMAPLTFASMMVQPGPIAVDGDHASARVYLLEVVVGPQGERRMTNAYDDSYVRCADGCWRFAKRVFRPLHAWGA